jgi:uncharacterized protein
MENETIIDITVIPRSSRSEIKIDNGNIKAYLNSPPEDGKANKELIKLISKKLKTAKTNIQIISGEKSRKKRIQIQNIDKEKLLGILNKVII